MAHIVDGTPYDFETDRRYSPVYGKTINQRTVFIPGGGCKFWLQTGGKGCPFCGFPGLTRLVVLGEGQENNFEGWLLQTSTFKKMHASATQDLTDIDKVAIFNGGSFFVDEEVPADFRKFALQDLGKRSGLQQVMVESRPSYLRHDCLSEAKAWLNGKDLMVGIGLESVNASTRNKLLKKGMSLHDFEGSVAMMQSIGVQVFVYVFLKAPGLSEGEAIEDAIATMDYLASMGVDEMALSCAFVPPNTPIEALYNAGEFRPPWLWSVMKIVKYAAEKGYPLSIGGFDDNPTPIAVAHNCEVCTKSAMQEVDLARVNGTGEFTVECGCEGGWLVQVE